MRPPPPGRGGGGVRPVAPASKPESQRTSHNAAPDDPARIVQGDEGVGARIHQRLSVVGRTVKHPSPAGGLDGGSDQGSEAGSLIISSREWLRNWLLAVLRPDEAVRAKEEANEIRRREQAPSNRLDPLAGSARWREAPDTPRIG